MHTPQTAGAQPSNRFSMTVEDVPIEQALITVNRLTRAGIIYEPHLVQGKRASCDVTNVAIEGLLECILEGTGLTYESLPSGAFAIVENEDSIAGVTGTPASTPTRSSYSNVRSAGLTGFVTDASDGQPLEGATVALRSILDGEPSPPAYGSAANAEGLYLIRGIAPGRYHVSISFVGYESVHDSLLFESGDLVTRSAALSRSEEVLGEVLVETELQTGAAGISAGHQRIRAEDIELIPSADLSADLANYLTALPGVVTSGARGGQVYVRGGEPSQNLVLIDGMTVYQPFHVLGSYSVFPATIVDRAEVYAGGFGGQFSGRLSSVIDVATRYGNTRRFAGFVSASPFVSALQLEGPIVPGHASFLVSARESFLERGAGPLIGREMPFRFGDLFAKTHLPTSRTSRLSITAMRSHDRGTIGEDVGGALPAEIRWKNTAVGARWLHVPRLLPVMMTIHLSHSIHSAELGPADEPSRSSTIQNVRAAMNAAFVGNAATIDAGWDVLFMDADNLLGGLFQLPNRESSALSTWGFYVQPELDVGPGIRLNPGLRVQWYRVSSDPLLEPRLRASWDHGIHHLSAAAGLYHQEVVGLSDRRDVANTFTIWTGIPDATEDDPRAGRIGRAAHAIFGYASSPAPWLEFSVEGFYKHLRNLFVGEWTAFPWLTTRLQPARGRALGSEVRVELRHGPVYAFLNYGLSSTRYVSNYEAVRGWFGTESLAYRPPHDRRHQVNALIGASLFDFGISARWSFGSGTPYTQPVGFDAFVLLDDAESIFNLEPSRRVIYERPYNALLPTYHRLDISVERTFPIPAGELTLQTSAMNAYIRRNIFYLDIFTQRRVDQLPLIPSFGIKVAFE
jgi:hypothetical protein